MTEYMVIENYSERRFDKIYERFHKNFCMLPEGLYFIKISLEKGGKRCIQLMKSSNPELLDMDKKLG